MRMTPRNVLFLSVLLSLVALAACGGGKTQPTTAPRELTVEEKARKAQSMLRAGRARDAIVIMEDALAETPDDARLHNLMGQIMFVAARYEPAVEHFNRALELDEYLTDAHNFLGAVYNELGKTNEAEKHFRIALDDPSYPTPQLVWLNLGMLYGGQGRDAEAIDSLRRAVEINPKFYQAHYELALLLEKTGRLDEAVREFKVAGPGFAQDGEYYYRLGLAHFRAGEMAEARQVLLRVADVAPGSPSSAAADDLLEMIH